MIYFGIAKLAFSIPPTPAAVYINRHILIGMVKGIVSLDSPGETLNQKMELSPIDLRSLLLVFAVLNGQQ